MRRGVTLVEMAAVVLIIGILCGIGIPTVLRQLDRTRVRGAASEIMSAIALARTTAIGRGQRVTVLFSGSAAQVVVRAGIDTVLTRAVGVVHGVTLEANRDSTVYGPSGLGYGAANLSIVVSRGAATDTILVSRLGRVRR